MLKTTSAFAFLFASIQAMPAAAAEYLFIRHAQSATNAGTATTVAEIVDPPLTALGQQQAADLADSLSSLNVIALYTSAYQRTVHTIAPTATHFGLTSIADARTNEWYFGDISSPSDLSFTAIYGLFGTWAAGDTSARLNLPNAESLDDTAARVLPAWQEIIAKHKADDGVVVIVGHGATMGWVMPYLVDNVPANFSLANGVVNTGMIQVKLFNDTPYVANWQGVEFATPVPEPEVYASMLAGLGLVGLMAWRRRAWATR